MFSEKGMIVRPQGRTKGIFVSKTERKHISFCSSKKLHRRDLNVYDTINIL